jgi:thioredoxin:protein disulfide reductase
MKIKYLCAAALAALGTSSFANSFLPPEQAFAASVKQQGQKLVLEYQIAPGYYLYQHRFEFRLEPKGELGKAQLPPALEKNDKYMGQVRIYQGKTRIELPVSGAFKPSETVLVVKSQGCAEAGLCYPPFTQRLPLSAPSRKTLDGLLERRHQP